MYKVAWQIYLENHLGVWVTLCNRCHLGFHRVVVRGALPVLDYDLFEREALDWLAQRVDRWVNAVAVQAVGSLRRVLE